MKLLFDQNLSPRLVWLLADLYPESMHLRDIGMGAASDPRVWEYASEQGFIIVSKDSDFEQMSARLGQPPKDIWIRRGNCSTSTVHAILREHYDTIAAFARDADAGILILS